MFGLDLARQAEVIKANMRRATWRIEMGRALIAAKADCRHGDWIHFLASVDLSPRAAQRYMNAAHEADRLASHDTVCRI